MRPVSMDQERVAFNLARLRKGSLKFEIAIDADLAIALKSGKNIDIKDAIKGEKIFSDVKKGVLASQHDLKNLFGTDDQLEVAKAIIKEGEIQLTTEHREKMREEKRRKIVNLIARNAIDSRTKLPHPPQRIENAFKEAGVKIDEHKSAEDQIGDIVKKLRPMLPISFETKKLEIKIPVQYTGKSVSIINQFAKPSKEEWLPDGSYKCVVELPAGLAADFLDKLNSFTHGSIETRNL